MSTFACSVTLHLYDGITTFTKNRVITISAEDKEEARYLVVEELKNRYKSNPRVSLSSVTFRLIDKID